MASSAGKIFVMRHATPTNPRRVMYGNLAGFPLSDLGRQQASEAGQWLSRYSLRHIISSPRERTHQTADVVLNMNPGHPDIVTDERLRDVDLGIATGVVSMDDFHRRRQYYWESQERQVDGMEAPRITQARMLAVFEEMCRRYSGESLLFVSHADPMAFLFQGLLNQLLMPSVGSGWGITKASIFEIQLSPRVIIKKVFQPTEQ